MSARKTHEAMRSFETLVDRRLANSTMLAILLADHKRQREDLIDLWERPHLHNGDSTRFLQSIDDEITLHTKAIKRLTRLVESMGAGE